MSVKYAISLNPHSTSSWQQSSLDTRGKYLSIDLETEPDFKTSKLG